MFSYVITRNSRLVPRNRQKCDFTLTIRFTLTPIQSSYIACFDISHRDGSLKSVLVTQHVACLTRFSFKMRPTPLSLASSLFQIDFSIYCNLPISSE